MNRAELVSAVAKKAELSKKDADVAVKATFDAIKEALVAGEKIQLIGFGTFEVRERKERQGRDPRTGNTITIKASKVPAFKAGKAIKEEINA